MIETDATDWTILPYPHPFRFAFTIVHDADAAYSARLRPVLDAFGGLGFRITVTAFPFWAAWADRGKCWSEWKHEDPYFAPIAVPLEDDAERSFYLEVARSGHEVAMHTPSETSSTRTQLIDALDFFRSTFGLLPRMYVEHSPGNNLDAQLREGANPESPYYNTDLLNDAGFWVWVADHGLPPDRTVTNLLKLKDAPFTQAPLHRYGILRGFLRNGAPEGDGDTFLKQYSEAALDALEEEEGLAILYTHLNYGWLDPDTRRLREPLRDRLSYLAQKPGWFACASDILDRFDAVRMIHLSDGERWLKLVNGGGSTIRSLALRSRRGAGLAANGVELPRSDDGSIVVDRVNPLETKTLMVC